MGCAIISRAKAASSAPLNAVNFLLLAEISRRMPARTIMSGMGVRSAISAPVNMRFMPSSCPVTEPRGGRISDPLLYSLRRHFMRMTRRAMIGTAGAAFLPTLAHAELPVPSSNTLSFRVMRKGSRIGTHALTFSRSGDDLAIDIAVTMAVYLGPIRMFHYNHHNIERWKGDTFVSMVAKTDYD